MSVPVAPLTRDPVRATDRRTVGAEKSMFSWAIRAGEEHVVTTMSQHPRTRFVVVMLAGALLAAPALAAEPAAQPASRRSAACKPEKAKPAKADKKKKGKTGKTQPDKEEPADEPAADPSTEAPAPAPAPSGGKDDEEGRSLQRGERVEFDARLIQGQTAKAGAVYLFARVPTNLKSMVRERTTFREKIVRTVYPDQEDAP